MFCISRGIIEGHGYYIILSESGGLAWFLCAYPISGGYFVYGMGKFTCFSLIVGLFYFRAGNPNFIMVGQVQAQDLGKT